MAASPVRKGRKPAPKRRTDDDGRVTIAGKAANGQGTVYWSPTRGRYEAKGVHPRTGKRIKRTGPTKEKAAARLAEALADEAAPSTTLGPSPTVAELTAHYLDHVARPRVAPTTLGAYRKQARSVLAIIGDRPVVELTKADGQHLVADLFDEHSYDHAVNSRSLAKRLFGEAIDLGYLTGNPLDRVPRPPRPDSGPRRTLQLAEQRALVREALALDDGRPRYRHGAAVAMLFTIGLRVSEVLGLRWDDLDFDDDTVRVQRGVVYLDGHGPIVRPTKTKATTGTRHLPPFLDEPLRALRRQQATERLALGSDRDLGGDGHIFVGVRHQLLNRQSITKEIRRVCKAVRIDHAGVATHTGRRTVITNLYVDGETTEDIAAAVGHGDPSTTRGYVQSFGDRPTATARRMAALIDDSAAPRTTR